jgi:hypothetical protein
MASSHLPPTAGPIGRPLSRRLVLQALGLGGATAVGLGAAGLLPAAAGVAARQDLTVAPPTAEAGPSAPSPLSVADKAAELQFDLERIFRLVADEVHYEAYVGALRGPKGTLWSRAGNSVDQALLLAGLLDEALVTYRFAIGELEASTADALLAELTVSAETLRHGRVRVLGLPDDPASAPPLSPEDEQILDRVLQSAAAGCERANQLIDDGVRVIGQALTEADVELPAPSAPALPDRERRQHVWIQYADGPVWIDLDPSIAGAPSGRAYATVTETVDALPEDLAHVVKVKVIAEEVASGAPRRRDVVAYEAKSRDLVGLMPAVGRVHFERSADGNWHALRRDPNDGEHLIVVSQNCDILAQSEHFVETMPCYWVPRGSREYNAGRTGNSGRYFLLREEGVGKQKRALIVDATDRVQLGKPSLLALTPEPAVADEQGDGWYRRFRAWLGGRYSRGPLDPQVVESVQRPIAAIVQELVADEALDPTPAVREIRMAPVRGTPPFELQLIVLVQDGTADSDERVANLVGALYERFAASADGTRLHRCAVFTADELLVADYERTWKLPYDAFSWQGEEEVGAPPVRGIDHG